MQAAEEFVAVATVRQAVLVMLLQMQGSYPKLPVIVAFRAANCPVAVFLAKIGVDLS